MFHDPFLELQDLILNNSLQKQEFWNNICQYNSFLTFTSLGYKKNNYKS